MNNTGFDQNIILENVKSLICSNHFCILERATANSIRKLALSRILKREGNVIYSTGKRNIKTGKFKCTISNISRERNCTGKKKWVKRRVHAI